MPRKILLADDSVTAQNMGKKILSDAGYEVITVSNGSAALKKATELLPDIVVLDVYMPGYSGLEVCKLLKENPKTVDLPILLTVGKLEPFKSEEALKARANAFIVKPFEATELLAVIRKIEDANAKAERKPKGIKPSTPIRAFAGSTADAPEAQESGIEEKGWKNRLAIPAGKKSEAAAEDVSRDEAQNDMVQNEGAAMGTAFRDLTSAEPDDATLRRESAFTADGPEIHVPQMDSSPAAPPLDISPEEIAAIKAAVEVLSGEGDRAPVLHVPAVDRIRHLAPEPEDEPEEGPEAAPVASEPQVFAAAPTKIPAEKPKATPWVAEAVELTPAEAGVALEREMQASLGLAAAIPGETFNTYSLIDFAESAVAEPVDDEPIVAEIAAAEQAARAVTEAVAEAPAAALAASASGDSPAFVSGNAMAAADSQLPGFQDLRPTASAAGAASAPNGVAARDISVPDDEIDSRTKSQMDAAWSNWREIRNTIVTPALTEQLADVVTAKEDIADAAHSGAAQDSAYIANIVDSVLAEMRPKLVEEIARKLAAKRE